MPRLSLRPGRLLSCVARAPSPAQQWSVAGGRWSVKPSIASGFSDLKTYVGTAGCKRFENGAYARTGNRPLTTEVNHASQSIRLQTRTYHLPPPLAAAEHGDV